MSQLPASAANRKPWTPVTSAPSALPNNLTLNVRRSEWDKSDVTPNEFDFAFVLDKHIGLKYFAVSQSLVT